MAPEQVIYERQYSVYKPMGVSEFKYFDTVDEALDHAREILLAGSYVTVGIYDRKKA